MAAGTSQLLNCCRVFCLSVYCHNGQRRRRYHFCLSDGSSWGPGLRLGPRTVAGSRSLGSIKTAGEESRLSEDADIKRRGAICNVHRHQGTHTHTVARAGRGRCPRSTEPAEKRTRAIAPVAALRLLVRDGSGHDAQEEVHAHAEQQPDLLLARDGAVQELWPTVSERTG
jgi:hypothetical protein